MNCRGIGRPIAVNVLTAMVLAVVFGAGTVAGALAIRSADIVDGEVKTVDLANGAVTTAKIAANAVTGAKINESTLGIVPNANLLDGRDSTSFVTGPGRIVSSWMPFSHGDSVYLFDLSTMNLIGFNIAARCSSDQFYFLNNGSTPLDIWFRHNGDDPQYVSVAGGAQITFTEADGPHLVTVHIVQPSSNRQASLEYSVNEIPGSDSNPFGNCFTYGEAVLNY